MRLETLNFQAHTHGGASQEQKLHLAHTKCGGNSARQRQPSSRCTRPSAIWRSPTDLGGVLGEEAKGVPVPDRRLRSNLRLKGHLHRRRCGLRGGQRGSVERAEAKRRKHGDIISGGNRGARSAHYCGHIHGREKAKSGTTADATIDGVDHGFEDLLPRTSLHGRPLC